MSFREESEFDEPVVDYWLKYHVNKGVCSLCGNRGMVDTRGVKNPKGEDVGVLNYCICPNGQRMRAVTGSA